MHLASIVLVIITVAVAVLRRLEEDLSLDADKTHTLLSVKGQMRCSVKFAGYLFSQRTLISDEL